MVVFRKQTEKTVLLSATIRAIYDKDAELAPQEQQLAIRLLPGIGGGYAPSTKRAIDSGPAPVPGSPVLDQ